jgi:16S rRNA (adenine1518-N6/adenine1519-N6)-dimethyltransferase
MGYRLFPLASPGECRMDHPLDPGKLDIPGLIKRHGLTPNKNLGQNFLIDHHYLSRVIQAAEINNKDNVLEIGAGVGNLTRLLAASANQVTAVEIDSQLINILRETTSGFSNIQVVHGDILSFEITQLISSVPFLVVANIPYYITSKIVRYLMSGSIKPQRIVLTIQMEVAERICAISGKHSLLSLSVQVFGNPSLKSRVPAGAFFPTPKVDSAIVRIDLYSNPLIHVDHLDIFFYLARAGFSQKRKNLRNSLTSGTNLDKASIEILLYRAGIQQTRRAESLSIEEWKKVVAEYIDLDIEGIKQSI